MPSDVVAARGRIADALAESPLPRADLLRNLGLYVLPMELKRFLYLDSLYRQILDVPGVILEFGTRWGQNLALFQSLRAIYEPYHHRRLVVGFDTFTGFPAVHEKDGEAHAVAPGAYGVTPGHAEYLEALLALRETQSPVASVRKFRVVPGDVTRTVRAYFEENPQTVVALAYFDLDLYEPTIECLRAVRPYLTRGSILAFDELNHASFPGETEAVRDALGLTNVRLRRNQWSADESYLVVE